MNTRERHPRDPNNPNNINNPNNPLTENRAVDRDQPDFVEADANRDPLSGEPGAHPVGTGIGAAAAGVIGTAVGAIGGPIGAVAGAAVGSFIGGLIGKSAAEAANPTVNDDFWRENYASRPYAKADYTYEDYQPAYRTGYEGYSRYSVRSGSFDEVEPDLRRDYESNSGNSRLRWDDARDASRDAWERVDQSARYRKEDEYWRNNFNSRPYYEQGARYESYQPAYQLGYSGYGYYRNTDRTFDQVEPELRRYHEQHNGGAGLAWEKAKFAAQDAWNRAASSVTSGDRPATHGYNDNDYWRSNFSSRPYYQQGDRYEAYEPAYRLGYDGYSQYQGTGRTFDQVEPELHRDYERRHGGAGLAWEKAKFAVQDAWNRAANTVR